MTKDQQETMLRMVEEDCEIRHKYMDGQGRTCFIGKLMKEAGIELTSRSYRNKDSILESVWLQESLILQEVYGVSREVLRTLQYINDDQYEWVYEIYYRLIYLIDLYLNRWTLYKLVPL